VTLRRRNRNPNIWIYQPTYEKVNEELFLDNPLHVILNKSQLAYGIYVVLIANKEFKKSGSHTRNSTQTPKICMRIGAKAKEGCDLRHTCTEKLRLFLKVLKVSVLRKGLKGRGGLAF
jgi:hypothetical protein